MCKTCKSEDKGAQPTEPQIGSKVRQPANTLRFGRQVLPCLCRADQSTITLKDILSYYKKDVIGWNFLHSAQEVIVDETHARVATHGDRDVRLSFRKLQNELQAGSTLETFQSSHSSLYSCTELKNSQP